MNSLPLHNSLKSLAWLEGTWTTKVPGQGQYPTIKPFKYCEEIKFTSAGQPMFNYEAISWNADTKLPLHRETGYLKVIHGASPKVKLVLAHNFGLTTIEEGEYSDNHFVVESTSVERISEGTKTPNVIKIRREFRSRETDGLEQVLHMATSNTPELTEHLRAIYVKKPHY